MQQGINKKNDHSLGPDFFTGWKLSATTYKFRQIPLFFTNPCADNLSKTLTSFGSQQPYRVVYMGARYTSNFKAFKSYSRQDSFEESICKFQTEMYGQFFLKYEFKFQHEKEKVFPIRPLQYRLFTGMNPTIKKDDLRFDANFQCGNLDLAISINSFQYDLLMRVDSNTRGHTTWFFFKVTNFTDNQKVKFNIINFQKNGLMYKEGMKPYCYRSSNKKWEQQGNHVQYKPKRFRYNFENSSNIYVMNCLSFMYQFKEEDEYVYFAYCVPYTYSYLMHRVTSLQKENHHFVQIQRNFFSTGGLEIPVLTITNSNENKEKPCCLAIGRLHPGETQGSWVLDGFLSFLCSPKGYYLRQKFIFKIIPMVNVDGVVLGNFRTGISGRDLNRVFDQPQNFPQIIFIRQLAQKYDPQIFLDFHGHSAKKNVFMYGPNYGVDNKYYLTSRLFPKFVSKLTSVFRFYSCIFRISKSKVTTGRAIMINEHNVAFSFTIESSSYAYGPKSGEVYFNKDQYSNVGGRIAEGLEKFIKILLILPKRLQKLKQIQLKQEKSEKQLRKQSPKHSKIQKKQQKTEKTVFKSNLFDIKSLQQLLSPQQKGLIQELINDQKQFKVIQNEQQEKSDSDFEDGDDYSQKELQKIFKSEIQDEISVQKIKKKKKLKSKHRKQTILNEEIPTQRSSRSPLSNKKQIKALIRQKSEENKTNKIHYKKKISNVIDKFQEKLPQIKRESQQLPGIEQSWALDQNRNKVYYNNWKKDLNPFSALQKKYQKASSSLNHITLDYNINKQKQQQYEEERKKRISRQKKVRSKFHREKDEDKSEKRIERNYSLKHNIVDIGGKQMLFPLLQKNRSLEFSMIPNVSPVEQILANHERIQKNYIRKNIKIVYF